MGLLSCHDSKLKIKFWKVETKCSKAQNLKHYVVCEISFFRTAKKKNLRCCAKNFSEFQICQCSPTVLVCFPGLKPCKWWSENWSANVWKKVLKLWKQSFAGLQSGKKKISANIILFLSFPSSEVQHSFLRCCAITFSEFRICHCSPSV